MTGLATTESVSKATESQVVATQQEVRRLTPNKSFVRDRLSNGIAVRAVPGVAQQVRVLRVGREATTECRSSRESLCDKVATIEEICWLELIAVSFWRQAYGCTNAVNEGEDCNVHVKEFVALMRVCGGGC